jgi:hypothetical protein
VVDNQHATSAPCGLDGAHQAGRAGADDQNVNRSDSGGVWAHRARIGKIGRASKRVSSPFGSANAVSPQ